MQNGHSLLLKHFQSLHNLYSRPSAVGVGVLYPFQLYVDIFSSRSETP